jgi:hypothetical protein
MNARWRAPAGLHTALARLPVKGELPSFGGATGWLNSPPLTPAGLRGNVVLVNFWTYTCINWLRWQAGWEGMDQRIGPMMVPPADGAAIAWRCGADWAKMTVSAPRGGRHGR